MFSQNLHCLLRSGMRSRREMKTLQLLVLTLLTLTGVLSDGEYGVNYPEPEICTVRGSDVIISCAYFYPKSGQQVQRVFWCSMNSNSEKCHDGPYVYNSDSPAASGDFKYVGDKTSNCTLLISNVQFSHSGEYKFRFITNVDKWTGDPGVTLNVSVVKVSMIRLSGNGTLKEGDSVNLTCAENCTLSSPQFVWFKNKERLPESGSVLHLPALTVRNSGNYSCALRNHENFTSEMISLDVKGVLSDGEYGVNYSVPICAVRRSDVIISCTYFYPKSGQQVERVLWCSMNSNSGKCLDGP
ncbi:uncharacterized protein LOC119262341 [Pygocentrus nattereri]|uniref:uncharacterized protein LOC119262341 n=1 Tax=Pygocentrus nattereri TaxID=42514 RepID=UPI0018910586|nr:uncharacterized protein LOC119262341 [Pygocentrus nattereri]